MAVLPRTKQSSRDQLEEQGDVVVRGPFDLDEIAAGAFAGPDRGIHVLHLHGRQTSTSRTHP
jgi:hypothetical protein